MDGFQKWMESTLQRIEDACADALRGVGDRCPASGGGYIGTALGTQRTNQQMPLSTKSIGAGGKAERCLARILSRLEAAREFRAWVAFEAERLGSDARTGLEELR
ncbi:unnamed protein product, partial [Sphacelaria rigidula]